MRGPLHAPAPRGSPVTGLGFWVTDLNGPASRADPWSVAYLLDGLLSWVGPQLTDGYAIYALVGVELFPDFCGRLVQGERLRA